MAKYMAEVTATGCFWQPVCVEANTPEEAAKLALVKASEGRAYTDDTELGVWGINGLLTGVQGLTKKGKERFVRFKTEGALEITSLLFAETHQVICPACRRSWETEETELNCPDCGALGFLDEDPEFDSLQEEGAHIKISQFGSV